MTKTVAARFRLGAAAIFRSIGARVATKNANRAAGSSEKR